MRPLTRATLTALTAAALVATPYFAGGAATAAAGDNALAGPSAPGTTAVTLITGDRVVVGTGADGRPTYTIAPQPGVDRTGVTFALTTVGSDTYIVPSDVADLTGPASVLDRELFNVTKLVAQGFDDARSSTLPLIVQRADGSSVTGVRGFDQGRNIGVLGAYAAHLKKSAVGAFGQELADADTTAAPAAAVKAAKDHGRVAPRRQLDREAGPLAGVSRIWLNSQVKAQDLDTNLSQVKAPAAWSAGVTGADVKVAVLDSGIDAAHPDLAGKVDAQVNFTTTPSMADVVGHGTHVAGTIAGTGAAADGARRGVAPDARLLIGKVLGDNGSGDLAWTVQGMEWAAAQGADIVNMSLGSGPTDGSDPVSQALNEISEEHGTLFVVAAGNTGPGPSTVSSPATADAALAVAAVDSTGAVASFSSRGPRVGDSGMKPEIAAPGVAITAPKSSAMKATTPDPRYVAMSGTSMATPHVAGVAALLRQQHPDWSGSRLKAVLMGTAADASGGLHAVGTGQADAVAALGATVVPDTGKAQFHLGDTQGAVSRTITLTNTSDSPRTIALGTRTSGSDVPADALAVSPATATVPAGGSVAATVTVDGSKFGATNFSGAVTVTPDSGSALDLPVAATRTRWLTVTAKRTDGAPGSSAFVTVLNQRDGTYTTGTLGASGTVRIPVQPGPVSVTATIQETGASGGPVTSIVTDDLAATQSEVVLDSAKAVPIGAQVNGSTREEMALFHLYRYNHTARTYTSNGLLAGGAYGPIERGQLRISPTDGDQPAGSVGLDEHWVLANADSTNSVGDATKIYDLAWHRDTVPADPVRRLGQDAVKRLARVDTDIHSLNEDGHRNQFATTVVGPHVRGLNTATPSYVRAPVRQTRYTSTDGLQWTKQGWHIDTVTNGSISANLISPRRTYEPGLRYAESFWGGPLGSTGKATLTGGTLSASFTGMADDGGHTGSFAEFVYPAQTTGYARLFRNDVLVQNGSLAAVTVDGSAARYRIERGDDSKSVFPMGGRVFTTWTTEPVGASGTTAVALPLLNLGWHGRDLDLANRATAGQDTTIDVRAVSAALDPADRTPAGARASYTVDGGATWTPVDVRTLDESGGFGFSVPSHALSAGTWIGLRFGAEDAAGNSVEQTLLRAFQVS
ncbi:MULTISPECIES: S8 family serine peptidase [unclassified Streptomyces]|uniref:S8 family peptidase n=1 Tax=unclassified Streptomyces TaxID=2593676 RepID=UPI0035E212AB